MLLIIKYCVIQVVWIYLNYVNGECPYSHQFYDVLSRDSDVEEIYNNYMSPISYDTYENDCHRYVSQPPVISDAIIDHALNTSVDQTLRYISLDYRASSGAGTPRLLIDMDRSNYFLEVATRYVQETTCSSKSTTTTHLSTLQLKQLERYMNENITKIICDGAHIKYPICSSKNVYSNVDGTCNNLKKPLDGRAGDCQLRLLPPDYKDGISKFRTSIDGSPLPNARLLSTNLLGQDDRRPLSAQFTEFHAFFGEFVISDNGMTLSQDVGMRIILPSCDHESHARANHPQCAGVSIPPDDVMRQTYPNQNCMPFTRTIPCGRCNIGPRMISNSITAAQDLNSVYGVSTSMLNARRTMVGGRLKSEIVNGNEIFATERFNTSGRFRCFEGKCELSPLDVRNVQLTTGHIFALVFHRNHNRHARRLSTIKPTWSDKQIFEEARKWNIAEYQHCVYKDYLHTLIGEKFSNYFGIPPKPLGQFSKYDPDVPIKTVLEFQSTAGRQGHAALTEDMNIIDPKSGKESKVNFKESVPIETIFYDHPIDGLLLAQMSKPAFETTPSVPFKTFLFDLPGRTFGLDLGTLDITRQRDHAVPGYIYYLEYCHNVKARSWEDLLQFIDSENIEKLKKYYKYVEDVELYLGGHFERKAVDALAGPTFACIIGTQFHNVKDGDRFFYEHGGLASSFSIKQLDEIKTKSSLASILCKNTGLKKVLRDPLRVESKTNQFVSCSIFDDIDYKLGSVHKTRLLFF